MLGAAGIRHRRLCAVNNLAQGDRLARAGCLREWRAASMSAGSERDITVAVAEELFKKLERMRVQSSPSRERLSSEEARQVRYVRPELVAEVEFRGMDGRRPSAPCVVPWLARGQAGGRDRAREARQDAARRTAKPPQRTVKLTHPDRLYWPDEGVTKEGLADYYAEVWQHIAPLIVGRPLALVRCPTGITGEKFFQKHAWKGLEPQHRAGQGSRRSHPKSR